MPTGPMLLNEEQDLVHRLRAEADHVKDCFTRYSIQALSFSVAALGAMLQFQRDNPIVACFSLLVVALLLTVVRIGIHKYETANRIFGYELHMNRRSRWPDSPNGWRKSMRKIGWEEAFYAWRIIQPTIYHQLYDKRLVLPTKRTKYFPQCAKWASAAQYATSDARYYAGSYLQKTFFVLHMFSIATCFPLAYMAWQIETDEASSKYDGFQWIGGGVCLITLIFVEMRIARIKVKRNILENELLSINSCAILWHALVTALFRVVQKLEDPAGWTYQNYTEMMNEQALSIRKNAHRIYDWCNGDFDNDYDEDEEEAQAAGWRAPQG